MFNLRYPGQYFDSESGLFYNWHRSYDPRTGRYTQPDPVGLTGGWNRFVYAENNALVFSDFEGLAIDCKVIAKLPFFNIEQCTETGKTPSLQDAKDAKRMSKKELDKACKNNGYKNAHELKRDLSLDSRSDIFSDKNGNMYSGPRQGKGTPEYLNTNTKGIRSK